MRHLSMLAAVGFVAVLASPPLDAHSPHSPDPARGAAAREPSHARLTPSRDGTSGQGALRFRVFRTSEGLPERAREVLPSAHGGFAVDRRPGRGEVYFALPGAGLLQISADLESIRLLDTDPVMRDVNLHNTTLWETADGTPLLSLPANDEGRVFTTTLTGRLVHTLETPGAGTDLGRPEVNRYFGGGGRFTPTDVDHLRGLLYVTTGYSDLDWVLTARVRGAVPPSIDWHDLAFGGRGTGPGQLGTGHGVTVVTGETVRIDVADRPHAEIDRFAPDGDYLSTLKLPEGSFPCDIDHLDGYAVVGALHGPDRDQGAPVYVLQGDQIVSEVWPKEELGLEGFQHVHNAVLRRIDGRFYMILQAWNPGDFAILQQVQN